MALSEDEKVRIRHHTGYGGVQQSATFLLGVPAGVQTAFMIEGVWPRLLPSHEENVRRALAKLDEIEEMIFESTPSTEASKVGNIEINPKHYEHVVTRYQYFQGVLCNTFQVPPNPFDARPLLGSGYNGGGGINVNVHN